MVERQLELRWHHDARSAQPILHNDAVISIGLKLSVAKQAIDLSCVLIACERKQLTCRGLSHLGTKFAWKATPEGKSKGFIYNKMKLLPNALSYLSSIFDRLRNAINLYVPNA